MTPRSLSACVLALVLVPEGGARAQVPRDSVVYRFDPIVATATRAPRPAFLTPVPVTVIDSLTLRVSRPNTVTDLFRELPGLDVSGVGAQQPRPIIRGQRGQRILLLQDGMRLNNTRRQHDFGEVPSLVEISTVERVEIVRGPASVLYGTDAIGGVVNLITRVPDAEGIHGGASYRFGGAGEQHKVTAYGSGRIGALDVMVSGAARSAGSYEAPAGTFGGITLEESALVNGTGVRDRSLELQAGATLAERHRVFVRAAGYQAEDAGFGSIDPAAYAPDQPRIDISYPDQRFAKFTAGYTGAGLAFPIADAIDVTAYTQDNERQLNFDLFTSFGPQAPPGAGVSVKTFNFTDLRTLGVRVEARKAVGGNVVVTYGADAYRDRSENTDSSETVLTGFGPPQSEISTVPPVPNATYRSVGAFVQAEALPLHGLTIIAGARVQDIHAETKTTPGVAVPAAERSNTTVVGAVNVLYALGDRVTLVGSVGRAFRSPNLLEWFYEGAAPEGTAFQVRNPDLVPETSLNVDVGARVRTDHVYFEAFAFRNAIRNGIRAEPTGQQVNGLPAFRNINVEQLLFRGLEVSAEVVPVATVTAGASFTWMETEDELDGESPVGDSYSSKLTASLRYNDPAGRFWAMVQARRNGEREGVLLEDNPIGEVIPPFATYGARGGVTVLRRGRHTHRIGIELENLTNELYAEFANASFFRPAPGRSITVFWEVGF